MGDILKEDTWFGEIGYVTNIILEELAHIGHGLFLGLEVWMFKGRLKAGAERRIFTECLQTRHFLSGSVQTT